VGWAGSRVLGVGDADVAALSCPRDWAAAGITESKSGVLSHYGFAGTNQMWVRRGVYISAVPSVQGWWMQGPAIPGDSGAGVFCGDDVCGIVSATDNQRTLVVDACAIKTLLSRLRKPPQPNAPAQKPAPTPMPGGSSPAPSSPPAVQSEDMEKLRAEIAAIQQTLIGFRDREQALLNEIEKLKVAPIFLDVRDENGHTSTTVGNLSGKKLRLKFSRSP